MTTIRVRLISLEVINAVNGADGDRCTLSIVGFAGSEYHQTLLARPGDKYLFEIFSEEPFKVGVLAEAPLPINLSREDLHDGYQNFGTLYIDHSVVVGPAQVTHDFEGQLETYWPPRAYHYQLVYDVATVAD